MQFLHAQLRKANWPRGPGDRNVSKTNKLAAEAGVQEGQQSRIHSSIRRSFHAPLTQSDCVAYRRRQSDIRTNQNRRRFANAGREEKA